MAGFRKQANLDGLLDEDERLADIYTTVTPQFNTGAIPDQIIVPSDKPLDMIDLAGCIEDTLHRMVDAGWNNDQIEYATGMVPLSDALKEEFWCEEGDYFDIDLGYVMPGELLHIEYSAPDEKQAASQQTPETGPAKTAERAFSNDLNVGAASAKAQSVKQNAPQQSKSIAQ